MRTIQILLLPCLLLCAQVISAQRMTTPDIDTAGCHCGEQRPSDQTVEEATSVPQAKDRPVVRGAIPPYLDPRVPVEDRITDLLPRLTLDEKVTELTDSWGSKGIPRLKVPALLKTEGLHGQSYSTGATIFPEPISMSSTFDTGLIYKVGQATALEAKAAGIRATWSPVLDVARDARWGRVEETYGEDPYWVSRMGVAWITGFQGEHMIAIPKHFAGHGEPLGGRDSHDVGLSDRVMRNIHLVPFRAAVEEAHAGGVMAAYSTWNGVPDNASTELLTNILREEWGFDGMVVSDCGGPENFYSKQNVAASLEEACKMAILAGVDIECGSAFSAHLADAIRDGLLKESDLDPNLRRVFRAKYRLGLFDHPAADKMVWDKLPEYDTPDHRALAREVSVEGSVLLRNEGRLLPLRKDLGVIAVIGPDADLAQTGDYSAKAAPGQLITVLQGVKSHVSAGTRVLYAKGCGILSADTTEIAHAVDIARQADAVVLVVGDNSRGDVGKSTTGENIDGATLEIPGAQRQLIKAVYATGKPVVLVLVNGKPFTLAWEAEHIPAILETWYPGEEGGDATADLVFGDRNPSGRLPITFPRHVGQLPLNYDYMPSGRRYDYYDMPFSPLYRFGHGLSYTTFKYSNLQAKPHPDDPGFVTVSADITNTGNRDGDEVAQLYITDMLTSVVTPVISLKGVRRISLKAGETGTVHFELTPYQLSLLDEDMDRVLEPGRFRVHVGGVSPAPPEGTDGHKEKIGFTDPANGISGEFTVPKTYKADFTQTVEAPSNVKGGVSFPVTVTVRNQGSLEDIASIQLYGSTELDTYRMEILPGDTKSHTFHVSLYKSGEQPLTVLVGKNLLSRTVSVSGAPARLTLDHVRSVIDRDGVLHYSADAVNEGSAVYREPLDIRVDGRIVAGQPVVLDPGEKKVLQAAYTFPRSGTFRVQVGNGAAAQMVVPGGISLALRDPLVYLSFGGAGDGATVRNPIDNGSLSVHGTPQYVSGRGALAFQSGDQNTYINAGGLDLYRKPFTLAAWVNISSLDNGQAGFFGGQAPMGADVDNTGTILSAGVSKGRLLLSFLGRDVQGSAKVPTGQWVHVAYTYDPQTEQGTVYLNGSPDKSAAQKPYAGQLGTIGAAPRLSHGQFALQDVLVTRSCLSPEAIGELYHRGITSLRNGGTVTGWHTVPGPLTVLHSWAEIPRGSHIRVTLEWGDDSGAVLDSMSVELRNGKDSLPLRGKVVVAGQRVRARVQLSSGDWNAVPVLQTLLLDTGKSGGSGGEESQVRWSTFDEWQKGTASGGISGNPQ
jgi:beta-glucosidase